MIQRLVESGLPQACTTFPLGSNSIIDGAGAQHSAFGGFWVAPVSRSSNVAGRWIIQMWSLASVAMPATSPSIQLLGNSFGQEGSTVKLVGVWFV